MTMKIILASSSPRRKELLDQIGLKFTVVKPEVEEISAHLEPEAYVKELASIKGSWVLEKTMEHNSLIIACDTIVWFNERILEKPKSEKQAIETLKELSSNTHEVYTSVCCYYKGRVLEFVDKTQVEFSRLSNEFIERYVQTGEPLDKAGSYGIQGMGQLMVKSINGTFPTVMGFPTSRFYRELKQWLKEESPL